MILSSVKTGLLMMLAPFNNSIAVLIEAGSKLSEAIPIFFIVPLSSSMSKSMSTLPQSNVALFFVLNSFHLPKRYSLLLIWSLDLKTSSVHRSLNLISTALLS